MIRSYGRILFVLAGVALAVYFAWKMAKGIDAFFYPWANEKSSHAVLIGGWRGSFAPDRANARAMWIELHRWHEDRAHPCADCQIIEGIARTCEADGTVVNYRVSGVPLDRMAKRIRLRVSPLDSQGMIDHEIETATGEWDGTNLRLTLRLKNDKSGAKTEMVRDTAQHWQEECEELGR
jgi:hypothetical protein